SPSCTVCSSSGKPAFMPRSTSLIAVLLAAAAFALYARRLDVSPPALHADEIDLRRQAGAVARTGRDTDGRRPPLVFRLRDNVWTPPVPVYATALVVTARRASVSVVRVPAALVAAIDVALMFAVARRLFGARGLAAAAAALIALTPSHFIHGRLAMASIYPV